LYNEKISIDNLFSRSADRDGIGAGCNEPCVTFVQRPEFPVSEYANLPKPGTGSATVTGQVFMRTVGGDLKYGSGSVVTLNPVTSYSTQAYEIIGNFSPDNSRVVSCPCPKLSEPDKRYDEFVQQIQADAEGRFEFINVPAGEYFVNSSVVWMVPIQNAMKKWIEENSIGGICWNQQEEL